MDTETVHSKKEVIQDRMKEFFKWFSDEYERVYVINLSTGDYTLTYFNDDNRTAPDCGDYLTMFNKLATSHVDEKFRDEFIRVFSLESMKNEFETKGNTRISFRYMGHLGVGRHAWKQVIAKPYVYPETGVMYAVCLIKDITDEKNYESVCTQNALLKSEIEHRNELDEQHERFEIIVQQTDADVVEWNRDKGYTYVSSRLAEKFYISGDPNGILSKLVHHEDIGKYADFHKAIETGMPYSEVICRVMQKNGEYIWLRMSSSNFYNDKGEITRVVSTILDVDEQTKAYNALRYRANYDSLTSLENKDQFFITAASFMERDVCANYAIIVFDIDKFRIINDVYGTKTGDGILCYIADAMRKYVKEGCMCRMYSDNFAILMKYTSEDEIVQTMSKIVNSLKKYPLDINVKLSYGVYKVDDPSIQVSVMCDWAGYAKKTIKGNALRSGVFYDETLRENMLEDKVMENEMEYALAHDQFRLYLQPKVDISTQRVIGAEALVRWLHPTKGLIPPGRFIPLFERNSFIINMDIYIWEQVCKLLRKWINEGKTPVPISVNVSRLHIVDPTLKGTLVSLTDKYRIPRSLIELEITETAFFDNIPTLQRCIAELKEAGFTVSMDDFGSGYSSLNMLKEVPVDTLKIDRAFLSEVVSTQRGKIVISHTIAMANELNLNVISEGVETEEQADFLLKNGCRMAQGFLYSKPLSVQNYEMFAYNTDSEHTDPPFNLRRTRRF